MHLSSPVAPTKYRPSLETIRLVKLALCCFGGSDNLTFFSGGPSVSSSSGCGACLPSVTFYILRAYYAATMPIWRSTAHCHRIIWLRPSRGPSTAGLCNERGAACAKKRPATRPSFCRLASSKALVGKSHFSQYMFFINMHCEVTAFSVSRLASSG